MRTKAATPLPNILESLDDLDRFHHRDLTVMTDEELLAEEIRTKHAYGYHTGRRTRIPIPRSCDTILASVWLLSHLRAIQAAAAARRGRAK
ncbi:MAG TPA: hypothetical protein VIL41_08575 [Coriobacteriia bacterium]